jgi:hypothetical protein
MIKEEIDSETHGEPTKVIVRKNKEGVIIDVMIKPNFKEVGISGLAIGYHFLPNTLKNHRDIFWNGSIVDRDYDMRKAGFSIDICGSVWTV